MGDYFNIPKRIFDYDLDPLCVYSTADDNIELSSNNLNSILRGNKPITELAKKRIREIDTIINSFTTKKQLTVYRGISFNIKDKHLMGSLKVKIGDILSDSAFMSTSYSLSRSTTYAIQKEFAIIMEIKLPKGFHCAPLAKIYNSTSAKKSEYEILLKRGTKMKVNKIMFNDRTDKTNPILYLEVEAMQ